VVVLGLVSSGCGDVSAADYYVSVYNDWAEAASSADDHPFTVENGATYCALALAATKKFARDVADYHWSDGVADEVDAVATRAAELAAILSSCVTEGVTPSNVDAIHFSTVEARSEIQTASGALDVALGIGGTD